MDAAIRTVSGELLALDQSRYDAMTRGDLDGLAPLLAEQLSYTHSTGAVETKAQYLEALRSGRVRYRRVQREVEQLATYEGCAVMQGRLEVEADVAGQPIIARTVFTSTWVCQAGAWQMAAWAATARSA